MYHYLWVPLAGCLLGCSKTAPPRAGPPRDSLSITNVVMNDGSEETLVLATNGVWITMGTNIAGINVGVEQSVHIWFDHSTERITKTLLELTLPNGKKQWVSDFNGDGIPDQRRIGGREGFDIFYHGEWYKSEITPERKRVITVDGGPLLLTFDGTNWSPIASSKP